MMQTRFRSVAAIAVITLLAGACGSDRKSADSTTTAAPVTAAVPATAAATTGTGTGDTAPDATPTSTSDTAETVPAGPDSTDTATTTVPTDSKAPDVPMFGDSPWPCGPGDGGNKDDGSEVGVTADSVTISGGDDAGYAGAPGLDHEATDAIKALVAKCNELGGINGRTINYNYFDAGIFNIGPAIQGACDAKSFFLVGEAWSFDGNQEEIRLACDLPAVPTFSVSAAFAMGKDVYQGTPNPADETPAGTFAMTSRLLPEAVKKVGVLAAAFSATQESRDKVVEAAPAFGWGFSITNLEYNPVGEADWTPFVKQLQDAGSTAVYFSGGCLPNLQLFEQAATANGFDVPVFVDANFYEAGCAAANTDGALDGMYTRMAFIPFEEADVNKATQDYLDLISAADGDVSLLGAQATSSFLLWATAASACGDTLTRACTLQNLADVHAWTGHGLHAETDPGGNHPPQCNITLELEGTKYARVAPEERGTFSCDPSWIAPIRSTTALAAAKLDADRISQQFAAG